MNNINISKKKKYYIDINYKPIYILSNGIKIFLIKKKYNNTLVNIELKINHPIINNKYIIIFKIIFKDLLKLGTKKLNIKKINNIIDNNQINFLLTFEGFKINILKKNIKNFFLLIIDIILNLNFKNEKKFIKLLKNIIFLLKIYKYNYELIINNLKNNILYENNNIPYNFFLKKKDLFTIKLNNVKKIYKKYFIPNNSYLFFYGDISKKKVISLSKKYFLKWKKKKIYVNKKKLRVIKYKKKNIYFLKKKKIQNIFYIKYFILIKFNFNEKSYFSLMILKNILIEKIKLKCKKINYIFNLNIDLFINRYTTNISINITTFNKNLFIIINIIKKIINNLHNNKLNMLYLNFKKKQYIENLLLNLENSYEIFNLIYNNYIFNFKKKFCLKIIKIINNINNKDIYYLSKLFFSIKYYKLLIIGGNELSLSNKKKIIKKNIKINYLNI